MSIFAAQRLIVSLITCMAMNPFLIADGVVITSPTQDSKVQFDDNLITVTTSGPIVTVRLGFAYYDGKNLNPISQGYADITNGSGFTYLNFTEYPNPVQGVFSR